MDTPFMDPITKISASLSSPDKVIPVRTKSPQSPREQKKKDTDPQTTKDQVSSQIQETVSIIDFKLKFSIDQTTKMPVVQVINGKTGKVIRQIPPSRLLGLAKSMKQLEGLFFDERI